MLKSGYAKPAAREACQSVLRAGRAFVFEQSDKAPKTPKGTVALFSDVAIKTGRVEHELGAALSRGLSVRLDVDYEAVPTTTDEQATEYVRQAAEIIAAVKLQLDAQELIASADLQSGDPAKARLKNLGANVTRNREQPRGSGVLSTGRRLSGDRRHSSHNRP
jgi:uncharacterized protein (UPF0332 family)